MRAIKFEYMVNDIDRGWCKEIFPLFDIERGFLSRWFDDNKFRFNPAGGGVVRRQFTGLLDKNGVEIYEGDILKFYEDNECFAAGYCFYNDVEAKFMHTFMEIFDGVFDEYSRPNKAFWMNPKITFEVIGNIHEAPELLEPPNV